MNIIKVYNTDELVNGCTYNDMQKTIFLNLEIHKLFLDTNFDEHHYEDDNSVIITHKEKFILNIIDTYMNIKGPKYWKSDCRRTTW